MQISPLKSSNIILTCNILLLLLCSVEYKVRYDDLSEFK